MLQLSFRYFFWILFCGFTLLTGNGLAQQQADLNRTLFLDAQVNAESESITLTWDLFEGTSSHLIFQRSPGSTNWGVEIATLDGETNEYTVEDIELGELYEFRVFRLSASASTNGYLYSGIEVEHQIFDKHLILVCTSEINDNLSTELASYKSILEQEGYQVTEIVVETADSIGDVKDKIEQAKNASNLASTSLFLLGNVPVPYSGSIVPDGHSNHVGAWPCDGYYGELDGNWTDDIVTNTSAQHTRTHNVPGDGKFDQNTFPSDVDIAVGRADFSRMPLFEKDEIELTRVYLSKNINFRTGAIQTNRQGIVENNFSLGEGFGQNGYKNMAALLGRSNVQAKDYSCLSSENYMWSYGAGGGNYQGASGIGNTTGFASDSLQTIFTMLFGSYFGDWDISNNFLRAALCTGTTLTNAWAGRPHWYFHPMGMGANIGDCTLLSMNNTSYDSGFSPRGVHMALMGDPTLQMNYINPLTKLDISEIDGHVQLEFDGSETDTFDRYYVYRAALGGEAELIGSSLEKTYIDSCLNYLQTYQYFVTAAKLHTGASGSYYIQSRYLTDSITINTDLTVEPSFEIINQYNLTIELINTTKSIDSLLWDWGDGSSSTEENPTHIYDSPGSFVITLTVFNECGSYTISETIVIQTSSNENIWQEQNTIYPNPATKQINLIDIDMPYPIDLEIINQSTGIKIKKENIDIGTSIDISSLSAGNYIIKINSSFQKSKAIIQERLVIIND